MLFCAMQSTESNIFRERPDLAEHIAATIPGILYIYDRITPKNLYSNGQAATVLGFTPQEVSDFTNGFSEIVHSDDRTVVESSWESLSPANQGAVRELRYRVRHKDGRWRWLHCRETSLGPDADGVLRHILGIALDITPFVEAEEKTKNIVAKLQIVESDSRAKSEVLATIGHDLRPPLNSVISLANLLDATTVDVTQKERIRTIRASGESILGIVDDVLQLSLVEAEKPVLSPSGLISPAVGQESPGSVSLKDVASLVGISPAGSALRILMAEDNPVNRRVGKLILQRAGFNLDVVTHGQEAVEAHQKQPYDLILMDCQMPLLDGLKATEVIRNMPMPQPIIVAVTANALVGEREKCLAAGMDDYISKPFRSDELVAIVKRWLEVRVSKRS